MDGQAHSSDPNPLGAYGASFLAPSALCVSVSPPCSPNLTLALLPHPSCGKLKPPQSFIVTYIEETFDNLLAVEHTVSRQMIVSVKADFQWHARNQLTDNVYVHHNSLSRSVS